MRMCQRECEATRNRKNVEVGFEDVILNHVPWSFISVSPKLNFAGSQVVTLLNLCDPLEGFNKNGATLSQGQIRKTKRGAHLGFQVQQAMNQRFVCVKPPLANLDLNKSILAKPS